MIFLPLMLSLISLGSMSTLSEETYLYSAPVTLETMGQSNIIIHSGDEYYTLNQYFTFNTVVYFNNASEFEVHVTSVNISLVAYDDGGTLLASNDVTGVPLSEFNITSYSDVVNITPDYNRSDEIFIYDIDFYGNSFTLNIPLHFDWYYMEGFASGNYTFVFPFSNLFLTNIPQAIQSLLYDSSAYDNGYYSGKNDGYEEGFNDGKQVGHQEGWVQGVEYGASQDETALTIFEGIITIALVPINFFLAIFNFEIFGINLSGFVSALLTVSIIIIVVRFLTGKKQDD